MDDMLTAMRLADPALSRFDPMRRIICFDDFDRGLCGWTQLVGNYEHTLDSMHPGYAQHTQPMLHRLTAYLQRVGDVRQIRLRELRQRLTEPLRLLAQALGGLAR